MPLIEASSVSVSLGGKGILNDVTFDVVGGTWVGLLGPNGSGKTTLLRALAGLLPHTGQLRCDGRPVRQWSARELARRLAFVRQTQDLVFEFTVMEYVMLGRAPHRGWLEPFAPADWDRAHAALAEVDLHGFETRTMTTLSGGERQRVRLAQALAQDPQILLLDEPTAHLDVHHQLDLMACMATIAASGRTIVAALHDLPLAARYVDRLLVLNHGMLAAEGRPRDVIDARLLRDVFRVEVSIPDGDPAAIRFLAPAS